MPEITYNVPASTRLFMTRGNDVTFYITVTKPDNTTRWDLTSGQVWFTVKRRLADLDSQAVFQKISPATASIIDETSGLVKIGLTAAELNTIYISDWYIEYIFDLRIKDSYGKIVTYQSGTIGIYPSVTKTLI
jgi:hypothetical protein